jgi:hypothetical protein
MMNVLHSCSIRKLDRRVRFLTSVDNDKQQTLNDDDDKVDDDDDVNVDDWLDHLLYLLLLDR